MKKIKLLSCIVMSFAVSAFSVLPTFAASDSALQNEEESSSYELSVDENAEYLDNSVLVRLTNSASLQLNDYSAEDFAEVGAVAVDEITEYRTELLKEQNSADYVVSDDTVVIDENDFYQALEITLDSDYSVLEAIEILQDRDDVLYAQPNYLFTTDATANDTYYSDQYAIDLMDLEDAWDLTTGDLDFKVGVIDSEINISNPDLANRYDTELSKSFIDGYTADVSGSNEHGTHVAGIIGAEGNNSEGITGICWDVSLVSLRTANNLGSSATSDVVEAIEYAETNNIKLLNFSSGLTTYNQLFYDAIEDYSGLFVCSAGNDSEDLDTDYDKYPTEFGLDNIISVASCTSSDTLSSSSNYGASTVDLVAPGNNIYSTYSTSYAYKSGTSMAAPQVTGVAALIWSKYPDLTVSEVKDAILNNVDEVDAYSDIVKTGGRLNAFKALSSLITLGDVNLDGMITVTDVTLVQKYLVGSATLSVEQQIAADVNKDGVIDSTDASLIQKMFM
ncbi:MAG: S8 family serine peptidase [Clostridiales bacterium]|nr:S8 family serine peptidase [Clostridiales bacterium]